LPPKPWLSDALRRQLPCGIAAVAECLTEHKGIALAAELADSSRALAGDAADRVREAFARSLLPGRLTQLLENTDDAGAQHALSMIEALPDACLAAVCLGLGKVTHRERRRSALDLLLARGAAGVQVVAATVRDGDGPFVIDLVGALARVPAQTTEARAVRDGLLAGIAHRNSQVRFESLRHLLARSPMEEAAQHASIALVDSETAVRRVAQEFLITAAPADAAPALERMVRDAKFGKRELGERRRLLLAYGRTGGTPAVKLLIDVLEKRRKDPDELREAACEVLAIIGATPARPVLERVSQNKKEDEKVRAAAAKAAKTIATKKVVPNVTPALPVPALPVAKPARPPVHVETPFPATRPVANPVPFQIVGTPRPATASVAEEPIVVGEEPLWQDEPIKRKPEPAPEIASLLQDYLSKTDPGLKPWPTAPEPPPSPARSSSGSKLAAVKLIKRKADQGDDEDDE
jgi:hypothetical protein